MSALPGPRDEAEVVASLRQGDAQAFDQLCLTYHDALWRFAYQMLRSREGAQDVVQDVFLDVWERRASLTITTSISAYLFSAVRRRSLFYLRHDRTTERIAAAWGPTEVPALGITAESPLVAVERSDLRAMLRQSLASLPPARRQAVALRWGEHLSYDEIAEAMGISSEAARAHVSRAYRALRELLQAMGAEVPE